MSEFDPFAPPGDIETTSAQGRLPNFTYASRGFLIANPASQDYREPARFVYKVFDNDQETELQFDGESWVISETEGGQYQFKFLVARDAERVKELWIQRVPADGEDGRIRQILNLGRKNAGRLIELIRTLDHIPVTDDAVHVRVDDSLIRELFENPESIVSIYQEDPGRFRDLIRSDSSSRDVIATAYRREQVEEFRRLLDDDDYFDARADESHGPENVWQHILERNPWILGISLGGQLMTSWDTNRLEQVVTGASIAGPVSEPMHSCALPVGSSRWSLPRSSITERPCWAASTDPDVGLLTTNSPVASLRRKERSSVASKLSVYAARPGRGRERTTRRVHLPVAAEELPHRGALGTVGRPGRWVASAVVVCEVLASA